MNETHDRSAVAPAPSTFGSQPVTRSGRLARIMLFILLAFHVLSTVLTAVFGRREAGTTVDVIMKVTGPLIGIAFAVGSLAALGFSLRALITYRERSFVVWLALALGLLSALFLVGELAFPH